MSGVSLLCVVCSICGQNGHTSSRHGVEPLNKLELAMLPKHINELREETRSLLMDLKATNDTISKLVLLSDKQGKMIDDLQSVLLKQKKLKEDKLRARYKKAQEKFDKRQRTLRSGGEDAQCIESWPSFESFEDWCKKRKSSS